MFKKATKAVAETFNEVPRLRLELAALKVERDFWVEQARNLQNHLQTVMRGQAAMLEQMAKGGIQETEVLQSIALVQHELRQPLTSVESVVALTATMRPGTQGAYTAVHAGDKAHAIDAAICYDENGRAISSLIDADKARNAAQRKKMKAKA